MLICDILSKVIGLVSDASGIAANEISEGSNLWEELDMEEGQILSLETAIEAEFGIEIPDGILLDKRTVQSVSKYVHDFLKSLGR